MNIINQLWPTSLNSELKGICSIWKKFIQNESYFKWTKLTYFIFKMKIVGNQLKIKIFLYQQIYFSVCIIPRAPNLHEIERNYFIKYKQVLIVLNIWNLGSMTTLTAISNKKTVISQRKLGYKPYLEEFIILPKNQSNK